MVGFEEHKSELDALGVKVIASSVDPLDKAEEVAKDLSFPVGYGVPKSIAEALGSWWEDRRNIIQPSEFVVDEGGAIVASSYSDGPIGRMEAGDVVKMITFRESQK